MGVVVLPRSGRLQLSSAFFKMKWPTMRPHCTQTVTKQLNQWSISSTRRMVISSRVVACTSQPVAFNGHPSTRGRLTGLRNKLQRKQTCQHLAVVYWHLVSLLIKLSIYGKTVHWHGVRKWRVLAKQVTYVTGFRKTDHIVTIHIARNTDLKYWSRHGLLVLDCSHARFAV